MLGITTSDAIALGSMIAALTAACIGLVRGDRAKGERDGRRSSSEAAPDEIGELSEAVRALADVLRTAVVLIRGHSPISRAMAELLHKKDVQ